MAAYLIVDTLLNDPALYEQYKLKARPLIEKFGGEYLARGGRMTIRETDLWSPSRLVLVRFPDVSARVILTPCDEVKVTHLGEYGGFLEAADVDPGASSGDTSNGPTGRRDQGDREAGGMLA